MDTLRQRLARFLLPVTALLLLANGGAALAAGNDTLTLTPAASSVAISGSLSVTIRVNSSAPINAVESDLSYDQAKLQFVSIDTSTSNFDHTYPSKGGAGKVTIARTNDGGPLTGSQIVAVVNFKPLVSSGSSAITFDKSSAVVRVSDASNGWTGITTGGTYGFTAAGKSIITPTPSPSPTASPTPSPAPGATATLYPVAIRVANDTGLAVQGATVKLGTNQAITDSTGNASFTDVAAGKYDIIATKDGKTAKDTITVADNKQATTVQTGSLQLAVTVASNTSATPTTTTTPAAATSTATIIFYVVVGLILLGIIGAIIWWILHQANMQAIANRTVGTVVPPSSLVQTPTIQPTVDPLPGAPGSLPTAPSAPVTPVAPDPAPQPPTDQPGPPPTV